MKKDQFKTFEDYNSEYGEEYYSVGCDKNHILPYDISDPHWFSYFDTLSSEIINQCHPNKVIDVGCAKGFLVSMLRDKGVEAFGVEVSEYALSQVRPDIKTFCSLASVLDTEDVRKLGRYDLVTCIEVLEHLPEEFASEAISNLVKLSDNILFSSTPDDHAEKSHVNVKPPEYWVSIFNKFGYYIDPYINITSIPHSLFFSKLDIVINKFLNKEDSIEKLKILYGNDLNINQLKKDKNLDIYRTLYELFFVNKKENEVSEYKKALKDKDIHINNISLSLEKTEKSLEKIEKSLENQIRYLEKQNNDLREIILSKDITIDSLNKNLLNIYRSLIWRLYLKYHKYKSFIGYGIKNIDIPLISQEKWAQKDILTDGKKEELLENLKKLRYKPLISIVMPVYNIDIKLLDKAIKSVFGQIYSNWELCIVDDASSSWKLKLHLFFLKFQDKRLKINFSLINKGIAMTSNKCIKMSNGEFITFLDDDDELTQNALAENIILLNKEKNVDLIYSDEDKIDLEGKRSEPFFKPDWSKYRFLSNMYTSHLSMYRKSIINEIHGFRSGFEGAQDYDLMLRFIEKTENIYHISKILYHWRKIEGSTSQKYDAKPIASNSSIKALKEYLNRNNIKGEVLKGKYPGLFKINYKILNNPKISIIIPTKDKVKYLKKCVESILKKTIYKNYEIVIIDNNSTENATFKYYNELTKYENVKILYYKKKFNFSEINNFAVSKIKTDYILFLNNDTEIINKDWLSEMVQYIQKEDVGIVGAKLLYPNGTIQHAGLQIGFCGIAGHTYKFMKDEVIYFFNPQEIREVSGVTGACLLIKKDLFDKVGGFDDKNLKIAFNDVDLCLKVRKLGYTIIYTPYAQLYHYESLSRGKNLDRNEVNFMLKKWKQTLKTDPYYNSNLPMHSENPLDLFI